MHADVLVKVGSVVESDPLETFQTCSKLVQLREAAAALLLNADLNIAYPTALKLDTLSNNFLLETEDDSCSAQRQVEIIYTTYRSLMISLWVSNSLLSFSRYAATKFAFSSSNIFLKSSSWLSNLS